MDWNLAFICNKFVIIQKRDLLELQIFTITNTLIDEMIELIDEFKEFQDDDVYSDGLKFLDIYGKR